MTTSSKYDPGGDEPREGVEIGEWERDTQSEVKKKLNDVKVYIFTDESFEDAEIKSEVAIPLDEAE